MAYTPYSAKNARVRINGATLIAMQWTVEESTDELDTSNFEGNGYSDAIGGLLTARYTIEINIDGQGNPWDGGLYATSQLTNVFLYQNGTSGPLWSFASSLVLGCTNPMDVKSSGKLTIRGRNKGPYVRPTGVIA